MQMYSLGANLHTPSLSLLDAALILCFILN